MTNKKALTDDEIDIIRRMAALNSTATVYRLNRIKKKTGRDPRRFSDLVELLAMIEGGGDGE